MKGAWGLSFPSGEIIRGGALFPVSVFNIWSKHQGNANLGKGGVLNFLQTGNRDKSPPHFDAGKACRMRNKTQEKQSTWAIDSRIYRLGTVGRRPVAERSLRLYWSEVRLIDMPYPIYSTNMSVHANLIRSTIFAPLISSSYLHITFPSLGGHRRPAVECS